MNISIEKNKNTHLFVLIIFICNLAIAATPDNSQCLSAILSNLPNFFQKKLDRATIKKIIKKELQPTDLVTHSEVINKMNQVEQQIGFLWANSLNDIIHSRSGDFLNSGKQHPLHVFTYPYDSFLKLPVAEKEIWFQKYPMLRKPYHEVGGDLFSSIQDKKRVLTESFETGIRTNPEKVNEIIKSIHEQKAEIKNEIIDSILGIRFNLIEQTVSPDKYRGQQVWHSFNRDSFLTPYEYIKGMYKNINLSKSDVVYDLGAGYGRVLFYGAHVNPEVTFKGVELVTERAREIEHIIGSQRIRNVSVINKNILDVDISDGTVFYLFNPFPPIMDQVVLKLKEIGIKKKIRIVSLGASTHHFDNCPWLRTTSRQGGIAIYESIPIK